MQPLGYIALIQNYPALGNPDVASRPELQPTGLESLAFFLLFALLFTYVFILLRESGGWTGGSAFRRRDPYAELEAQALKFCHKKSPSRNLP